MKYFDSLPIIAVTRDGYTTLYRNLLSRVSMIPSTLQNPLVYYTYDLQEGDTPEIVAEKYYGSPYRFWIVLYPNQMFDPQWDWPLNSHQLQDYIVDKYTQLGFDPYTTTKTYQKTISVYNVATGTNSTNTVEITQDEYNELLESSNEYETVDGVVTISITKKQLSYYDYEVETNENKRSIKLLNKDYVTQIESEFASLMGV